MVCHKLEPLQGYYLLHIGRFELYNTTTYVILKLQPCSSGFYSVCFGPLFDPQWKSSYHTGLSPSLLADQERIEKRRHIVGKRGEDGWKRSGNSCFTGYFSALVAGGKTTGYLSEKGRLTKQQYTSRRNIIVLISIAMEYATCITFSLNALISLEWKKCEMSKDLVKRSR